MLRYFLLVACCGVVNAAPIGSRFTIQGELRTQGALATGLFDFQACLDVANAADVFNCTSASSRVIDAPVGEDTTVAVAGLLPLVAYPGDSDGNAGTGGTETRLYVCTNSTCSVVSPRILDASIWYGATGVGTNSAVAVRADGRPVVAYLFAQTGDVRIHVCSDARCN